MNFRFRCVVLLLITVSALACTAQDEPQGSLISDLNGTLVHCDHPETGVCTIYAETEQEIADRAIAYCSQKGGVVREQCPSEGLKGCCVFDIYGVCYADSAGPHDDDDQASCEAKGHHWSSTTR